jgi:formate dehydrogenase major subunit
MSIALEPLSPPRTATTTLPVTINGRAVDTVAGQTILDACRSAGIAVPTLCHDERLKPGAACRLCLVQIKGRPNLVTACSTPVTAGMEIETHTAEIETTRRTLLELLAIDYPAEAPVAFPEKPFHRLLRDYGVSPSADNAQPTTRFRDSSHPYLAVDMTRCVTCFRCVRICNDVQGQSVWHPLHRGAGTNIVPDGSTMLTSSCVSCGACADTCPTGAIEDQSVLQRGTPTHWTRTTCPYCGVGCEMNVGTRNDRMVQLRPALDAPVNKGHLCVKGRYAFDFVHSPDRITDPMIRERGEWRTSTWDEAITFVARQLQQILHQHGPNSIGVLGSARGTNEENYLAQKFARVVLGTNNVDCCARVCHAPTAAGMKKTLGTGAATNSFDDIEHAATILVCGSNATEAHPVVGARIRQAVRHGARLIVIDPRETELARIADVHLALRPGTNVPLLNALAHVIVSEELCDADTVHDRLAESDAFFDFIRDWTPERAAAITGVPADRIRAAAKLYASHSPSMSFHGLGATEHSQGTDGIMCLVNLALLTGNFGKPGSGVNPLRGQNNVQGSAHMGCEPSHLTGYVSVDDGRAAFEAAWKSNLPRERGLNLMEMIDAAAAGQLKALWAIGYDIAHTNPNGTATRQALHALDLVIVQDLLMNELAREHAHVFLPACSSFEKDGTFMNSERRVQRVRRALEPIGHSRPDWVILRDIATAMGRGDTFDFDSPEEIWNEIRTLWSAGAGISYERLEHGGLQWPCPTEQHPGTPILHAKSFPRGPRAALQRVEFHATDETVTDEFPFLLTTGRALFQFNAGTMTNRTPNARLRPSDTLDVSPDDAVKLNLATGDIVRLISRRGAIQIPARISNSIQPGQLFATFHSPEIGLNELIGDRRDSVTGTPEYKVVAVRIEKPALRAVPSAFKTPFCR